MKKLLISVGLLLLVASCWFAWGYYSNKRAPQCGGIAGMQCPAGYRCVGLEAYPDAAGRCVKI